MDTPLRESTSAVQLKKSVLWKATNSILAAIEEIYPASKPGQSLLEGRRELQAERNVFIRRTARGARGRCLPQSWYNLSHCCCISGQLPWNVRQAYADFCAHISFKYVLQGLCRLGNGVPDQHRVPSSGQLNNALYKVCSGHLCISLKNSDFYFEARPFRPYRWRNL